MYNRYNYIYHEAARSAFIIHSILPIYDIDMPTAIDDIRKLIEIEVMDD